MLEHELARCEPARLADLLNLGAGADELWSDVDMRAIFRHQLIAPTTWARADADIAAAETLDALLSETRPSLAALRAAKDAAKSWDTAQVPPAVARAVYFTVIAAALVRLGQRITDLDPEGLRLGLRWVESQAWVDPRCRELAREALSHTDGNAKPTA